MLALRVPQPDPPLTWRVSALAPAELTTGQIRSWADLEANAAEPNAYLSPHFVLPALRHLDPHLPAQVYLVETVMGDASEVVAAAVVVPVRATRLLPWPHRMVYQSRYANLSGVLLDAQHGDEALVMLLAELRRIGGLAGGLEVHPCWSDGLLAHRAASLRQLRGIVHHDVVSDRRAVLVTRHAADQLQAMEGSSRMRQLRRHARLLSRRGTVGWRWHREGGVPAAAEAFLALEHAGWKGKQGTSLRSSAADEAFFRDMVSGFAAERRALFVELTLDDQPIASICNLVSGRMAHGFKIGWDPAYRHYAPGLLNEIELMRGAQSAFPDIDEFDSGSMPFGYIDELWPTRRNLAGVILPAGPISGAVAQAASAAWRMRRALRPVADPPPWPR